jgi:hypothetical protein
LLFLLITPCMSLMMMKTNPITPPPELVAQWFLSAKAMPVDQWVTDVATKAAQWGADQELEACINYFYEYDRQRWGENSKLITGLRAARRPKPPTLKEKALELARPAGTDGAYVAFGPEELALIRRALEALDD